MDYRFLLEEGSMDLLLVVCIVGWIYLLYKVINQNLK